VYPLNEYAVLSMYPLNEYAVLSMRPLNEYVVLSMCVHTHTRTHAHARTDTNLRGTLYLDLFLPEVLNMTNKKIKKSFV
jgi:hypothetical protein